MLPASCCGVVQIASVQVSGGNGREAAVTTATPRGEATALWLRYTAIDAAGNVGAGLRQVLVVCSNGERVCFETDSTRPSACSLDGECIDASLAGALGDQTVQGRRLLLSSFDRFPAGTGCRGSDVHWKQQCSRARDLLQCKNQVGRIVPAYHFGRHL